MKKSMIAIALVAALVLTVFAACGKSAVISEKEAQKRAFEYLGVSQKDVTDVHTHIAAGEVPGYSFHITCGDQEYSVLVDAVTGEVVE